jgi:hypothetical protein
MKEYEIYPFEFWSTASLPFRGYVRHFGKMKGLIPTGKLPNPVWQ